MRSYPDEITAHYASLMKEYGIYECTGDAYAGDWPTTSFAHHGITYLKSERKKSDIFHECLPILRQGRAELLDDRHTVAQFAALECRTSRAGRDSNFSPLNTGIGR